MPQTNTCVTNGTLPPDIYTANLATQLTYNIDFDFEAEADVVVYREQPAGTFTLLTNSAATGATPPNYTINEGVSPAQVTFNTGEAPGGVSLIVGRRTGICDPVVTFQVGAAIRAQDLNASNTQLLHLIQEMRSTLGFMINGNDTDPIIPGQGMDLGDLDDVTLADPIPNPSLLRWNGTDWVNNDVLESGDAWVSNNSNFATTAAGDDRWLNATGGNVIGGDGITVTEAGGNVTISVDLDDVSGLEFDNGELRIDANNGCEIVADGLNTQTTGASVAQTGGTNANPAIRITETLGATTTNTDLVITGGANTTVTRNSDNQLTIASSGGSGLTYRGTVDVTDSATRPTDSNVNDVYANDTQGTQTADWQTVITGTSTTANAGDLLLCTTAAGGTAANGRYTLIESGTNIPAATTPNLQAVVAEGATTTNAIILDDTSLQIQEGTDTLTLDWPTGTADRTISFPDAGGTVALTTDVTAANTLQQVTTAGNTTDRTVSFQDGGNTTIQLNQNGGAIFNEQGAAVDFRVEGDTQVNLLFVDGSADRIGIGTNAPTARLDARGGAVFNENGGAVDFRIESDDNENMFFVDGDQDRVGIGTNAPDSTLAVNGQVTIAENAIAAGVGNWNLANGNFWTLGAVVVPNPTSMVEGMSGLIVNTAAATWPVAGGATFQYAANTPPNITEFPAVIPFYCTNNTTIFIGTPTVNIV